MINKEELLDFIISRVKARFRSHLQVIGPTYDTKPYGFTVRYREPIRFVDNWNKAVTAFSFTAGSTKSLELKKPVFISWFSYSCPNRYKDTPVRYRNKLAVTISEDEFETDALLVLPQIMTPSVVSCGSLFTGRRENPSTVKIRSIRESILEVWHEWLAQPEFIHIHVPIVYSQERERFHAK
jgi:hypothetical protein